MKLNTISLILVHTFNLISETQSIIIIIIIIYFLFSGQWWQCKDSHHSSFETNASEMTMLWNLLCNPYLTKSQVYCCAGDDLTAAAAAVKSASSPPHSSRRKIT